MGLAIPQVITPSKASGAQVIDGSLKFDEDKNTYLKVTPGTNGNRRTWTWSGWIKRNTFGSSLMSRFFMGGTTSTSSGNAVIAFYQDRLFWQIGSSSERITTTRLFRDTGWYHIVVALDTTQGTSSDRVKIYVNGQQETLFSTSGYPSQNTASGVNSTQGMLLGAGRDSSGNEPDGPFDGQISNSYLIDGLALGPEYFGFTDPLTNTWKPKKFDIRAENNPNNGTTWSNLTTASSGSFEGSFPKTNLFDGIASNSNRANLDTVGASIDIDFSSNPITVKNTISIWSGKANLSYSINGGAYVNYSDAAEAYKDIPFTGTLTSLSLKKSDEGAGASAIKIDGYVLLDGAVNNSFNLPLDGNSPFGEDKSGQGNDFTPINFGGQVELDNPQVSGARPILNTTQGGTAAGVGVFGSKQNVGYAVTVYNDGGGNKYYIDGVKQDTVTGLIRGATYTFDTSDSTVSSHPFRFSATSNGSHGGGSEYTTGVAAITGAATTITVPHDAPNTLYYYCTSHSGMGADITGITTNEKLADQYASSCVLALPLVFRDMGDVSASITCTRTNSSVSNNGNVADTGEQSNFYNRSFEFDGSGDSLSVSSSSDFGMGTGDFTIEAWVYPTSLASSDFIVCLSGSDSVFGYDSDGSLNLQLPSSGAPALTQLGPKIAANKWNHFAAVRESGNLRGYVDGVLAATVSNATTNMGASGTVTVGDHPSLSREITGYLQDVRIYKGVAKYTSDFVVPSTSPDILPDTPSGVSGSSKLAKITDGSFSNPNADGIRQFGNISVADSADLEFGSGDFTLEAFIYYVGNPGTSNDTYAIFSKWNNVSAPFDKGFILRISDDGSGDNLQWFYTTDGSTNLYTTGSTLLNPNTWYHIAFVRNGSTGTFYVDGVPDNVTVSFGSNSIRDTGNAFRIGANLDGEEPDQEFKGFISNVRVIKGTALYTSKFTPPSEPLTNITNTKILACQDNDYNVVGYTTTTANGASPIFNTTGDYGETYGDGNLNADSNASDLVLCLDFYANATDRMPSGRPSNQKSLSAGGDPDPGNTTTSHFYGKSAYFDGNDQYSISSSADFSFDGEFCIELWANASSWGPFFVSGGTNGIWLGSTSSGLVIRRYGVQNDLLVQLPPYDEWVHLAFTRDDSNILRLFINGEEQGIASVNFTYTQNTLYIGGDGAGAYYTGYIQDLRVYKGTAKYTSDFNPPFSSLNRVKAAVSPSQFRHTRFVGGPVSFNPFITDTNTVRGQETGYCTFNPLDKNSTASLSNGNLNWKTVNGNGCCRGTISVSSGKWYFEFLYVEKPSGGGTGFGILSVEETKEFMGGSNAPDGYQYYSEGASFTKKYNNGSNSNYGDSFAPGDLISVALDMDNGTITFYKNGVSQGQAFSGISGTYAPAAASGTGTGTAQCYANFGQKPFKFAPPDGFQPLNTANVRPETVISRPDQYVGITTWTGDGTNNRVIQAPIDADFAWIKFRNQAYSHSLYDTVRGNNKRLVTNSTGTEGTVSFSFLNDKNIQISGASDTSQNDNNEPLVGWFWRAGGNKNTFNVDDVGYATAAAAGMSDGTMTVTGSSVGTKQGFSVLTYTGTNSNESIPHGLDSAPSFYIVKARENSAYTDFWSVYHQSLGKDAYIKLNSTDAASTSSNIWNNTAPTDSLFYVKSDSIANENNIDYVAYLWHDVPGLQKFGEYSGTGSSGNFIKLGFRPALLLIKSTAAYGWAIVDTTRSDYNVKVASLYPNKTDAEYNGSGHEIDYLSNGFNLRNSNNRFNKSSTDYIYAAWAEAPSIDLYGGGANAR